MAEPERKDSNVVKMQKLRHAVDRLRNIRHNEKAKIQKKSWLTRLKERLKSIGGDQNTDT